MRGFGHPMMFGSHPFFQAFREGTASSGRHSSEFEDLGSEYKFVRQVAGFTAENLNVEVRGSMLAIRGQSGEGEETVEVDLSFIIPADVASECIMAEIQGDRLTVILPKAEPRTIAVATVVQEVEPEAEIEPEEWELQDRGREYRVQRDVQGVTPEDISVDVTDGRVVVASSRPGSEWAGTFQLPSDAPVDAIFADIEDGKLTVIFPKSKGRKVQVFARARGSVGEEEGKIDEPSPSVVEKDVEMEDVRSGEKVDGDWIDVEGSKDKDL